jgi:uncharacterized RDD family membrane protein YckC
MPESSTAPIDTRIEIVTPENIGFQYRVAGPFRRLPAYLIDLCIRMVIMVALAMSLLAFNEVGLRGLGIGVLLIGYFLLEWFYGGLFETYCNGQTPGKRLTGLRVVSDEGQPINGWQAVLRNFLRAADSLPAIVISDGFPMPVPTYLLGLLAATVTDRCQRLGDLAAGTMVIVEEPQRHYGLARVTEPAAVRLAGELPAGFQASRDLARGLAAYVQRRHTFGKVRRAEVAGHIGRPLIEKFGLPARTDPDLFLCALYYRVFQNEEVIET